MAAGSLPPPPINDKPGSFTWLEWYRQLRSYISTSGSVPWYIINFAGSNITDLATYLHNSLQGLQGGAANEKYHLTSAEYAALGSGGSGDWKASRVYNVGQGSGFYASIDAAITAINATSPAPSSTNRVVIQVWPGKYTTTSAITVPSYVGIKGISKGLVQFQNNTTDIFTCSGNNWFEDFLIEGGTSSTTYAFNCNNADKIHIRRVDMLNNGGTAVQKFLKQVGSTWKVLFIEDCIVDYYYTSGYAVLLHNNGSAARYCDTIINNVFFDAYQLTGYGGSFQLKGVQDVRFRNSTIRGAATYNTGIRLELSGVTGIPDINVRHCYLGGGVPIYNESGTYAYLRNVSAFGSLFDGSASIRNSFVADEANVSVTTADVTLKGHEYCAGYLRTYGALTNNRNIIVPTGEIWQATVYCNNTGAFTTTIKTSGGSGVVVAQGKRAILACDGVNVVRVTPDT